MLISACDELKSKCELGQDLGQQETEPLDQAAEVVTDRSKDGIGGIAVAVPEVVPAHAMLGFETTDHGLDGGTAAQFALDLGRHPPLLA